MSTYCEDFPCCGHEAGDCDGSLYGSDESIKARVEEQWRTGHGYCEHESGIYNCDGEDEEPPEAYGCRCGGDPLHPRSEMCGS